MKLRNQHQEPTELGAKGAVMEGGRWAAGDVWLWALITLSIL